MEIPLLKAKCDLNVVDEVLFQVCQEVGYGQALTCDQREAIIAFLSGKDVFVSLPTGSGKSLCFALIPKSVNMLKRRVTGIQEHMRSVILVVSPLVGLMQDQVAHFNAKGIPSVVLNRTVVEENVSQVISRREYELVFVSPEALNIHRHMFRDEAVLAGLVGLAVDEAHCIHDW